MRLYGNDWSLYPRRVQVYLAEKALRGIEHEEVDILTGANQQAAYLELNPCGTLPTLSTGGDDAIRQFLAIILYIEETHPQPNLLGATPIERARTHELVSLANDAYLYRMNQIAHLSPVFASRLQQAGEVAEAMSARFEHELAKIETLMADGVFLAGPSVTIADCVLFASEQYVREVFGCGLPARFPKLREWYERFARRPSARTPVYPAGFREIAAIPAGA